MIVIPAIDLHGGKCVRLLQGRRSSVTVYHDDPVAVAQEFAQAGAEIIHVVDLDAAFNEPDSPNRAVLRKMLETVTTAIEFGGGVRSLEDVQMLIDEGVTRVVLGTIAAEDPDSVGQFAERFSTKICVGIDARDRRVMSRGWETATLVSAVELAQMVATGGVERIIYTDIARDGALVGPNIEQTLAVARAADVQVTASGGVSSLDDIRRLRDAGDSRLDSVIVGKALYEGKFKLEAAIRAADSHG